MFFVTDSTTSVSDAVVQTLTIDAVRKMETSTFACARLQSVLHAGASVGGVVLALAKERMGGITFWIWSILLCIGVDRCAWPRLRRDKGMSMKPTSNLSKFFCCLRKDVPEDEELRDDMDGADENEVVDSMEDSPS
jgi:hypothetical protein